MKTYGICGSPGSQFLLGLSRSKINNVCNCFPVSK
ncbi:hypothetical protein T4C_9236 [Trichinella pseudospiralis]|uniref:Uncharacterized protein n=1 Tax=Trichinella pseudospiralis TaxID=6337 RepID=A0A0V1GPC2_TRIPS|nr:hypothetical protein T4C_9236 [Trichinella pseudospiralis]